MEECGGEKSAPTNVLEGGERMLAKMVEERDKNKLDLFLQEMDNLDKFLDDAGTLLRSGHDQSSSGMDELLQISDGDLLPIKDIPVMIEGGTSAMQIKKESVNGLEEKPKKIKREAPQEDDTVHQNVVPQMITRSSVTKNIKTDAKPIVNNDDSAFDWLKTIPLQQNQKSCKPSTEKAEKDGYYKFGIWIPGPGSHVGNLSLKCEICDKDFSRPGKLAKHISRCVNNEKGYFEDFFQITPEANVKVETKVNVADADALQSLRNLKCKKCKRQFSSQRTLTMHASFHNRVTRFPCPHCDANLQSATSLATHIMIHTGEKPHKCEKCGKFFRTISNLQKHQISHREKKPFPCPQCDKAYCEYKSLMDHFKSHTGEMPFSCQVCKKPFKTFANMRTHQKQAHEERTVFKCDQCEFKSFYEKRLKAHNQVVHLKIPLFECDICQMNCTDKTSLKVHKQNKHEGVKFPCPQCDYKASQKTNLNIHRQRMHDGIIYKCDLCDYKASAKRNISCHKKLKHNNHS